MTHYRINIWPEGYQKPALRYEFDGNYRPLQSTWQNPGCKFLSVPFQNKLEITVDANIFRDDFPPWDVQRLDKLGEWQDVVCRFSSDLMYGASGDNVFRVFTQSQLLRKALRNEF